MIFYKKYRSAVKLAEAIIRRPSIYSNEQYVAARRVVTLSVIFEFTLALIVLVSSAVLFLWLAAYHPLMLLPVGLAVFVFLLIIWLRSAATVMKD